MKNCFLLILAICSFISAAFSQHTDSLQVVLSKENYQRGDSLEIQAGLDNYEKLKLRSATVHVWIDNRVTKKRWKFRYPLIEGTLTAALKIDSTIPSGNYAISFLVVPGFYRVSGQITEREKADSVISYMMRTSSDKTIVDRIKVDKNGGFTMKPMLFQDKASFYFSPLKRTKINYLAIDLKTPVDSIFDPVLITTAFFTVGNNITTINKNTFSLLLDDPQEITELPNVTVYAKAKTKAQEYDEQYSSGLFKNENAIIFDGLSNDELANAPSLAWYLQQKIPGLTVVTTDDNKELFRWRQGSGSISQVGSEGSTDPNARPDACSIFVDEFEVGAGEHTMVFPRDIAMIKVFRPPFAYSSTTGFNGAIAIYTRKGKYTITNGSKYSFILKGYTPFDGTWN